VGWDVVQRTRWTFLVGVEAWIGCYECRSTGQDANDAIADSRPSVRRDRLDAIVDIVGELERSLNDCDGPVYSELRGMQAPRELRGSHLRRKCYQPRSHVLPPPDRNQHGSPLENAGTSGSR
jgi:hypothetical protein